MEEKKYLFVADIPNEYDRFEKVTQAFMRRAIFTNALLVILIDATAEGYAAHYRVMRTFFGRGGKDSIFD